MRPDQLTIYEQTPKGQGKEGGDTHPTVGGEWLSSTGNRRCTSYKKDGWRCRHWAVYGGNVCPSHGAARGNGMGVRTSRYQFGSSELQKVYETFRDDPNRLDIRDEVAISRKCLAAVVTKIKSTKLEEMTPDQLILLKTFTQDVANMVKTMCDIEKITQTYCNPEQLVATLTQVCKMIAEEVKDPKVAISLMDRMLAEVRVPTGGTTDSSTGFKNWTAKELLGEEALPEFEPAKVATYPRMPVPEAREPNQDASPIEVDEDADGV